jgi:hypothetical protein
VQAGPYAAGYQAEIKTSNEQRCWRGGLAAFYNDLLLYVICKICALPNMG